MRSTKVFLLSFSLVLLVTAASYSYAAPLANVGSEVATPRSAHLEIYPFHQGPLSVIEEATLGLRPVVLPAPWTGYNYYRSLRGDGRWVLETLPAGTLVLADNNGNPVYKASCGNRLAEVSERSCPICPKPEVPRSRLLLLLKFLDALGQLVLGLFGVALLLGLILLSFWLLDRIWDGMGRWPRVQNATQEPVQSAPSAPVPDPAPAPAPTPAAAPAAPTASPAPAPAGPRFVAFYRGKGGEPHKLKVAGFGQATVSEESNAFTIRFK